MTDIVHIVDNIIPTIQYNLCLARKANGAQCGYAKKVGDFCGTHAKQTNPLRIDMPLPEKKRRVTKKKINNDPILELGRRYQAPITKFQAVFRGWYLRKINTLRGQGYKYPSKCNNEEDVYTFEPIREIHPNDFFSITDPDGFIYGFHIETIYKYITIKKGEPITNPYNKNLITNETINNIEKVYRYCKRAGIKNEIQNCLPQDSAFLLRNRVLQVFQKMDDLNNYTDINWFYTLDHRQTLKLVFNIKDLFEYRMELQNAKKYKIVRGGLIFIKSSTYYKNLPFEKLRYEIIQEFDRLVSEGETRDDRYLGSLIILSAFVELVPSCALAYPWLVQGTFGY